MSDNTYDAATLKTACNLNDEQFLYALNASKIEMKDSYTEEDKEYIEIAAKDMWKKLNNTPTDSEKGVGNQGVGNVAPKTTKPSAAAEELERLKSQAAELGFQQGDIIGDIVAQAAMHRFNQLCSQGHISRKFSELFTEATTNVRKEITQADIEEMWEQRQLRKAELKMITQADDSEEENLP